MRVASVFAFASALTFAAVARGQTPARTLIRITARDSTGGAIPSAELTVTRGLREVIAKGTTDDGGHAVLPVELKETEDLQVTMRKIGYARGDRFFEAKPASNADVAITVARRPATTTTLAPVTVTAQRDFKRMSYHLDADEIDSAQVWADNAWELIKRMRPDMLTSRGGCATGVQEVWVNGKRIRLPLYPSGMAAARARVGVPSRARFSYIPVSVLSDIAPEHILEINYHDCFDASMAAVGSVNAMFVVLKPGVIYKQDVGSFVLETTDAQK
jgi:hypothetical protein